jgi:hypothetical protein
MALVAGTYCGWIITGLPGQVPSGRCSGRVGTRPDTSDLDEQIAQVCREKESAIDGQDYAQAALLRDRERELLASKAARQEQWAVGQGGTATRDRRPSACGRLCLGGPPPMAQLARASEPGVTRDR